MPQSRMPAGIQNWMSVRIAWMVLAGFVGGFLGVMGTGLSVHRNSTGSRRRAVITFPNTSDFHFELSTKSVRNAAQSVQGYCELPQVNLAFW